MKRFVLTCKIEFILLVRNFFGFFFGLIFPLMMLILFGTIYGNSPIASGSELRMMDLSIPGYSVMVMGVAGLMSFPLTLAECKERKIYKRFDATPVGKKHIILAQITVNLLLTVFGTISSSKLCRIITAASLLENPSIAVLEAYPPYLICSCSFTNGSIK